MGLINDAIQEGIDIGFEQAVADRCDGYHEPQERCPMRPRDGCACLRVRWRKLPWWKKAFTKEPQKPDRDHLAKCLVSLAVDEYVHTGPSKSLTPLRHRRGYEQSNSRRL